MVTQKVLKRVLAQDIRRFPSSSSDPRAILALRESVRCKPFDYWVYFIYSSHTCKQVVDSLEFAEPLRSSWGPNKRSIHTPLEREAESRKRRCGFCIEQHGFQILPKEQFLSLFFLVNVPSKDALLLANISLEQLISFVALIIISLYIRL